MAIFNGRNYTLADFLPFNYTKIWDQFWNDVLVELGLRATAVGAALVATSSTNNVAIGTGTKTLTIETGKGFAAGMYLVATDGANSANSLTGRVTSYTPGTGVLVLSVPNGGTTGSGTPASWTIGISGSPGGKGDTGPVTTYWGGTAGGTANALTATTSASLSALTAGMIVGLKVGASANTSTATLAVDSTGAIAIRKNGAALASGDLPANTDLEFIYDGTYWRIAGGAATGGLFSDSRSTSSNGTITVADKGFLIECTAALTLTPDSAATLGKGFSCVVTNLSLGAVTLSGTINSGVNVQLTPGQWAVLMSTGSALKAVVSDGTLYGWTWSQTAFDPDFTLSSSYTLASLATTGTGTVLGSTAFTAKQYFEVQISCSYSTPGSLWVGVAPAGFSVASSANFIDNANGFGYRSSGVKSNGTSGHTAFGTAWGNGAAIGVAVDVAAGKIWFSLGGVWQGSGDPAAGINPAFTFTPGTSLVQAIFGNNGGSGTSSFQVRLYPNTNTPPTGFTPV